MNCASIATKPNRPQHYQNSIAIRILQLKADTVHEFPIDIFKSHVQDDRHDDLWTDGTSRLISSVFGCLARIFRSYMLLYSVTVYTDDLSYLKSPISQRNLRGRAETLPLSLPVMLWFLVACHRFPTKARQLVISVTQPWLFPVLDLWVTVSMVTCVPPTSAPNHDRYLRILINST